MEALRQPHGVVVRLRGKWVFPPGEIGDAQKMGVSPGENAG